jgi:drug/metabolite transporter (DMT)-like permease
MKKLITEKGKIMFKMSNGQIIVGSLVVFIYGLVMALYIIFPDAIPQDSPSWSMLLGALISSFTMVLSWFFGSSKSSADKTALMSKNGS